MKHLKKLPAHLQPTRTYVKLTPQDYRDLEKLLV